MISTQRTAELFTNLLEIALKQINAEIDEFRAEKYWQAYLEGYSQEEIASALASLFATLFQKVHNIKKIT